MSSNSRKVRIEGGRVLHGANTDDRDVRTGAAMAGGLIAKETTIITNVEFIFQGYVNLL